MNNITMLMRKELIYLFKGLKSNFIIATVFALFPIFAPSMALSSMIIVPYIMIYAVMAHEEKNSGDLLNVILPVNRKEICMGKYCLGMLYCGVTAVLVTLSLLVPASRGEDLSTLFISMGIGNMIGVAMSIGLIYIAIMLPLIYKFGTIKIRYYMFILYILAFAGGSALSGIFKEIGQEVIMPIQPKFEGAPFLLLIGIALLIYVLSYELSVKIFEKKEFR